MAEFVLRGEYIFHVELVILFGFGSSLLSPWRFSRNFQSTRKILLVFSILIPGTVVVSGNYCRRYDENIG